MDNEEVKSERRPFPVWRGVGISALVMLVFSVYALYSSMSKIDSMYPKEADTVANTDSIKAAQFANEHMIPVLQAFIGGTYHNRVMNKLYTDHRTEFDQTFQTPYEIDLSVNSSSWGPTIGAHSRIQEGKPTITLYIPLWMEDYNEVGKEVFEADLLICMAHEMNYLIIDHTIDHDHPIPHIPSDANLTTMEAFAWARTCQEIIEPLVNNGIEFGESSHIYYEAWIDVGKQINRKWLEKITEFYKPTRDENTQPPMKGLHRAHTYGV